MIKINKKVILMIILVLMVGILGGCSEELPEGIESNKFVKDVNEVYDFVLKSMSQEQYYKDDIDKILDKMKKEEYQEKLNDYELSIYELLSEVLVDVENDLTTGEQVIKGDTHDAIMSIMDIFEN